MPHPHRHVQSTAPYALHATKNYRSRLAVQMSRSAGGNSLNNIQKISRQSAGNLHLVSKPAGVRSHSYLYLFGFVEEYIVPFVVNHIQSRIHKAAPEELQALLHFVEEETKHIELFQRLCEVFRSGSGYVCAVVAAV
jgi:hypothetical protein